MYVLIFNEYFKFYMKELTKLLLFLIFFNYNVYCQVTYYVKDSLSGNELPYANVNFKNGYGFFANEKGVFIIKDSLIKEVEISYIGYKSKKVILSIENQIINLQHSTINLNEVVIKATKKLKKRFSEVNAIIHNDVYRMYWSSIGMQYAFKIANQNKESFLEEITIPIIKKDFNQITGNGPLERQLFNTVFKINFYTNLNEKPNVLLNNYEQVFAINSSNSSNEFILKMNDRIDIPENGMFLILTILGNANENNDLMLELPYNIVYNNGKAFKHLKLILPDFPLVELKDSITTYFRYPFVDKSEWKSISQPMFYSLNKTYPIFNIGLGYKVGFYD